MTECQDYKLFLQFADTFMPVGFAGIDPQHPLVLAMEETMEQNDQFFYLADPIRMKILYTSKRSSDMMGISPQDLSFYHFMEAIHPDDKQRLSLGRVKLLKMAQELFMAEKGYSILSANFKLRNAAGLFSNILVQNYIFYSDQPDKNVYFLKVHTNIDWCRKSQKCYHYYTGNDLSYFRYPDEKMLSVGNIFSERELEIVSLVESGLSTEQIAERLFLSPFTVNTHRGNIIQKSGKAHISDVIYDLKERGLI